VRAQPQSHQIAPNGDAGATEYRTCTSPIGILTQRYQPRLYLRNPTLGCPPWRQNPNMRQTQSQPEEITGTSGDGQCIWNKWHSSASTNHFNHRNQYLIHTHGVQKCLWEQSVEKPHNCSFYTDGGQYLKPIPPHRQSSISASAHVSGTAQFQLSPPPLRCHHNKCRNPIA